MLSPIPCITICPCVGSLIHHLYNWEIFYNSYTRVTKSGQKKIELLYMYKTISKSKNIKMIYGYVYAASNESMPGIIKIGMTTRHPETRLKEANRHDTWRPTPFKFEMVKKVKNPRKQEKRLHKFLSSIPDIRINPKREFFRISIEDIKYLFTLIDGDVWEVSDNNTNYDTNFTETNLSSKANSGLNYILDNDSLICEFMMLYNFTSFLKSSDVKHVVRKHCFTEEEMNIWIETEEYYNTSSSANIPAKNHDYVKNLKNKRAKLNRIVRIIMLKIAKNVFEEQHRILEREKAQRNI